MPEPALASTLPLAPSARLPFPDEESSYELPLWRELFTGLDWLLLRTSLVHFGYGVPHGDGAPVITVPGFLGSDLYLFELQAWLQRIGYAPVSSGITRNQGCPGRLRSAETNAARCCTGPFGDLGAGIPSAVRQPQWRGPRDGAGAARAQSQQRHTHRVIA